MPNPWSRFKQLLAAMLGYCFGAATSRYVVTRMACDLLSGLVSLFIATTVRMVYGGQLVRDTRFEQLLTIFSDDLMANALPFAALSLSAFCVLQVYRPVPPGMFSKRIGRLGAACLIGMLMHLGLFFMLHGFQVSLAPKRTIVLPAWFSLLALSIASRSFRTSFGDRFHLVERSKTRQTRVEDVLVVGGAGYIGSVLTRQLLKAGYRVRILDLQLFGDESLVSVEEHPRLEVVPGDFRNVEDVVRALRGMDAVIHLAAIVGDPACAVDADTTIAVNYEAAKMMARLSRANGISRFIFASTCSVYGATDDVIDEESALNPVSLYATTKIDAERALMEAKDNVFQPTILRLATAYGWSFRPRFDLVANLLSAKAVTEGVITIFNGEQWRPFVNTRDIARAMIAVLEAPLEWVGGQIFNVGDNSQNFTLSQLGHIVADAVPGCVVEEKRNDEDPRNYRVRFDKIRRVLGFRASVSLVAGIDEIVTAVKSGEVRDWRDPRYSNLQQMQGPVLKILKFEDHHDDSDEELRTTRQFLRRAS